LPLGGEDKNGPPKKSNLILSRFQGEVRLKKRAALYRLHEQEITAHEESGHLLLIVAATGIDALGGHLPLEKSSFLPWWRGQFFSLKSYNSIP
jgi:hypothetical protein